MTAAPQSGKGEKTLRARLVHGGSWALLARALAVPAGLATAVLLARFLNPEELGKFYAQRTILKREVLPDNIANAVFVLCTDQHSHTTGLHIPVDAGVAAAFLR